MDELVMLAYDDNMRIASHQGSLVVDPQLDTFFETPWCRLKLTEPFD